MQVTMFPQIRSPAVENGALENCRKRTAWVLQELIQRVLFEGLRSSWELRSSAGSARLVETCHNLTHSEQFPCAARKATACMFSHQRFEMPASAAKTDCVARFT